MTNSDFHTSPAWSHVIREQVRAIGIVMRPFFITLAALCFFLDALAIAEAWREAAELRRGHAQSLLTLGYTPSETILFVAVALILGLLVWQDESVSRRTYHWAMPVSRTAHALAKVLSGWCWVMVVTAIGVLNIVVISVIVGKINGAPAMHSAVPLWTYLIPFTATTVTYAFASAAAVGARAPFVYVGGIPIIYAGTLLLLAQKHEWRGAYTYLLTAWVGRYGAFSLMGGGFLDQVKLAAAAPGHGVQTWMVSFALWSMIAASLLIATSRHQGRSR